MFERILQPRTEAAYALMRIMLGALFAFHGAQKILGIYSSKTPELGSQMWLGGLIELVGGLGIALGIGTRPLAFLSSGMMAVAYTQFHWKLQTGAQFFPSVNKGELAVVYAFAFLFIACRGPGIWRLPLKR